MELFKKTGTPTHSIYQVYGIKIKIKNNKFRPKLKKIYNFVESSWSEKGASDELIFFLEQLKWLHSDNLYTFELNLIYISCLYEKGPEDRAIIALKEHIAEYGIRGVADFLPVAFLANKIGVNDEQIRKAACIFEHMEKFTRGDEFTKYLKDKSVAVVGNSPKELGQKKGKMIDSCDVVVRMNDFIVSDEFKEDYGQKKTIWLNGSGTVMYATEEMSKMHEYDWIIIPYDFWHFRLSSFGEINQFINFYYDVISKEKTRVIYFNTDYALELKQKKSFALPSSGIIALWIIYKAKGSLSYDDIYAITTEAQEPDVKYSYYFNSVVSTDFQLYKPNSLYSTYFKDRRTVEHWHDLSEEISFQKEFIQAKSKGGP